MRICAVRKKNGFAISAATGSEHDELTQKEGFDPPCGETKNALGLRFPRIF